VVRAKEEEEAHRLQEDALILQEAGCFSIVLEKIPAQLATSVSESLLIPTIGIGAGVGADGQVLVVHDMLGINQEFHPRFLRRYHSLYEEMLGAMQRYVKDVRDADFPNEREQY
jgi:3-methyl-2-oxobutanoate hydroxymethyltransferase